MYSNAHVILVYVTITITSFYSGDELIAFIR